MRLRKNYKKVVFFKIKSKVMSSKKRKFEEIEESKLEKVIDLGNGYIYKGELKDDKMNGKGKMTSPSGSVYEGQWKDNKRHGQGKQTFKNEDVFYEGQWKDNKRHGKGIMKHDDGYIYDGEWKDDKMHGKGKMTSPNGTVYEGKWIDDKKHDKGKMKYSNGDVFVGEWKDDEKHKGKMTFQDGDIYEGEFERNMFHGYGKYSKKIDSKKIIYYEGKWINGKKQGKGKETFPNGTVFEGEWQDNHKVNKGKITYFNGDIYKGEISPDLKKNGRGLLTSQSGFIYDGEWKDDKKNGRGKVTTSSGNIYEGGWKDDKFHGNGKLTKSSHVYEGEFENGKKNGKGKTVYENGDVYDGEWTDDKKHGKGKYTKVNGNFYEGEFNDDKKYTYGSFYSSSPRKLSKGLIERNKTTNDAKIKYGISKEGETTSYIINGQEILEIETLPKYIKESIKKTCEEATKFNYISIKNENENIKKLYEERKTSAENSIHFKVEGDSLNNIYLEKVHTSILNKYPYFTTRLKEGNFKDEPIGVEICIEDKKTLITEEKKIIISKIIEDFIKILYFEETERNEETACELERLIDKYLIHEVKLLGEIEDGRRSRKKRKSIRKSKNKKSIKKGIKRKSKNKKIKKSIKKRY
jgi:hypothetical protein